MKKNTELSIQLMLTKEEAEKLIKIKGNVRGDNILTNVEYVREREGEEGVKKLEKKLAELGYPLKFKEIQSLEWYPIGWGVLEILVIKEIFNWTDKDVFEMGSFAAKVSFMVRTLMKYFISPEKSFKESPRYWQKNFDFGELEAYELNEKGKYAIFRLRNFKVHPILCINHAGYFLQMARYVLSAKESKIKETKCVFKGDPYREYTITWK